MLIESRAIGAGQTGRMTGQALGWWTHSFQDAETRLGAEKATVLASSIKCAAFSAAYNGLSHAVRRCAGDALLSGCGHAAGLGKDGDLGHQGHRPGSSIKCAALCLVFSVPKALGTQGFRV